MMGERILIDEENVAGYLVSKGFAGREQDVQVTRLGGKWGTMGVSSTLLKVELPDASYVLKQPMPNLAVKDDWPADPDRIFMEERCIETLSEMFGRDMVPQVVFVDRDNYIGMFTYIPPDWVLWKRHLLDGKVDHRIAVKVGEILAHIHNETHMDPKMAARFAENRIFLQLRVDPYYNTIARRVPEVRDLVLAEVERVLSTKIVLVHGDYSPKNVLVNGTDIVLLDHEIAHWGEPTPDFSFCLSHLSLKFIHMSMEATKVRYEYLDTIKKFSGAYADNITFWDRDQLNKVAVRGLGCFILARIDGKSPVEYISRDDTWNVGRRISKRLILDPHPTLEEAYDFMAEELKREGLS